VGAEAITCCGWQETREQGVLGDRVHCRHGESNSSLLPNVLPQTPQKFAVKLCADGLAMGDEFVMNNATDVEKHNEHGLR
jgi:hypothetical protein